MRFTSSEDSTAAESIVLGVLDGDAFGNSSRASEFPPTGLNSAAKSYTLGDRVDHSGQTRHDVGQFDGQAGSLFSPDAGLFGLFGSSVGEGGIDTQQHEAWNAPDPYLVAHLSKLSLHSEEDFQKYRSRPNGVSLVDEEGAPSHMGASGFVPRSYGHAEEYGGSPSYAAAGYGDFLGYSNPVDDLKLGRLDDSHVKESARAAQRSVITFHECFASRNFVC